MMELIGAGDWQTVVEEATWERMLRAGNFAAGFLDFVLLMGVARGASPTKAGLTYLGGEFSASMPHMAWDLHLEGGPQ